MVYMYPSDSERVSVEMKRLTHMCSDSITAPRTTIPRTMQTASLSFMAKVANKRLTYAQLTGKDADALHRPSAGTGQTEPF